VWTWISGTLFPLFVTLADWLGPVLTAAIQGLSDFWTGTLQPALEAVWGFVQEDLIPLFEALRELFDVALTLALTALAGLWQNVLQPALEDVWSFIKENLFPIFEEIGGWLGETFGPIIDDLVANKLGALQNAFISVRDAVKWVIDKIDALIKKLKEFKLPPILEPGSPTPFEVGLRGIGDALDDLSQMKLPKFTAALDYRPLLVSAVDVPMTEPAAGASVDGTSRGMVQVHVYIDGREMKEGVITEIVERGRLGQLSADGYVRRRRK
jgi:hypothetical protein